MPKYEKKNRSHITKTIIWCRLVRYGQTSRIPLIVTVGFRSYQWLMESNFVDFLLGDIGCLGVSTKIEPLRLRDDEDDVAALSDVSNATATSSCNLSADPDAFRSKSPETGLIRTETVETQQTGARAAEKIIGFHKSARTIDPAADVITMDYAAGAI